MQVGLLPAIGINSPFIFAVLNMDPQIVAWAVAGFDPHHRHRWLYCHGPDKLMETREVVANSIPNTTSI